jgi:hypothetical protein
VFRPVRRSSRWLIAIALLGLAQESVAAEPSIVPVIIVGPFSNDQQDSIRQAAGEWNRTLNGHIRFEIRPITGAPKVWAVTAVLKSRVNNKDEELAMTTTLQTGGGLVFVYLDRLGSRNLEGIMLHEFGHVLGLQHEGTRGLMAATYNPYDQKCVDYAAAAQAARLYNLPLQELKWCGESGR